jgi:hypothetical protein
MTPDVYICPWCAAATAPVEVDVRRCPSCLEAFFVSEDEP